MEYLIIIISAVFVNNIVLSQFLGICPFLGVSNKVSTATGMSAAVVFVITLSTLVIILKKISPSLYQALGIFLPLITTNCTVLGVAINVVTKEFTFGGEAHLLNLGETVVYAASSALGFGVAMILFAGIREQMELVGVPKAFKGTPIALITAGILAMAFMGFSGLV